MNRFGNNIFLRYTADDKENKTTSEYAIKINETTLEPSPKIILATFKYDTKHFQPSANYRLSEDGSKILLYMKGPSVKDENKKFYLGVFDTDLKKQWVKEVELPILGKYVDLYSCDITNEGKIFLAIKHYDQDVDQEYIKKDGEKVPSYTYKLLVFSQQEPKYKEIKFNADTKFMEFPGVAYNNGTVTVGGYYRQKFEGNLSGVYYASFDANSTKSINAKLIPFSADLVRLIDKDNFGSDKAKDPGLDPHFLLRQMGVRENGTIDLTGEYFYLEVSTVFDSQNRVRGTKSDYQYGDIVVTQIDKDGKAIFTRVPKNQKFPETNLFLGFYPLYYKGNLVLLYNDDKGNVDRDLEKKPDDVMKFKKSVMVAATINAKGELSRQAIYDNNDEDYIFIPAKSSKISSTEYLICSDFLKFLKFRTRFGIMSIK